MSENKELYKCDPNKNTQCSKSGCMYNKNSKHRDCKLTTNKEFSTDGILLSEEQLLSERLQKAPRTTTK